MNTNTTSHLAITVALLVFGLCVRSECAGADQRSAEERIDYSIKKGLEGELVVLETVIINASVSEVWDAYTTTDGYEAWAAPVAEVDLRPGGTIRTTYVPGGDLQGEGVNTLKIVNYVPHRLLTLQADTAPNWPEILKADAANLYNVILFEQIDEDTTRIMSYGLGFTDSNEMRELMTFFQGANAGLYKKLIAHLEQ